MHKTILLAIVAMALPTHAFAQVAEVRLGANFHDIDWTGAGNGNDKERSAALNGEIVFEEPEFLKWALSPQPYIGRAINLEGETSYGGGGLLWRQNLSDKIYADFSFGVVVHDGTLEVKPSELLQTVIDDATAENDFTPEEMAQYALDLAEFRARQQSELDFGNRLLFRQQITIGYRWSENWSTHVFVEHLSHGNILTSGKPNEGLDALGMRISRHF